MTEELFCSIDGCQPEYPTHSSLSYGWCNHCEEFSICYKQDEEHDLSLLYNESCRSHHNGGYSVCKPCAIRAFKIKNPDSTEERCICPVCAWDFGKLSDLETTRTEACLKRNCSIKGCQPVEGRFIYGSCNPCGRFTICSAKDQEHNLSLLYNESCRSHDNGGYSVCRPCALNAFKIKNHDSTEERCICPVCDWDFGKLSDLETTRTEACLKRNCSIKGCQPVEGRFIYGSCNPCGRFTICSAKDQEHNQALLYNEGCRSHDNVGYSVCKVCALRAFKLKNPDSTEYRYICPVCDWDFGPIN